MDQDPGWCQHSELLAFFAHPARYLLEKRLGLFFRKSLDHMSDREAFVLNALERYEINNRLYQIQIRKQDISDKYATLKAAGRLPHGSAGQFAYEQQRQEVGGVHAKCLPFASG